MLIKEAKAITGGIGFTTKTGFGFGLPAKTACGVGCKLAEKEGSTCFGCYANGGNYKYPSVKQAHVNRLNGVKQLHKKAFRKEWVNSMVTLIESKTVKNDKSMWFFRWHDSGDIVSVDHLHAIADIAEATPEVKHWIPTKEIGKVRAFLKTRKLPKNLNVRLSGYYVDKKSDFSLNLPVAEVYKVTEPKGHICPAILQHKGCREVGCRACWNKKVKLVNYKAHR